MPHRIPPFLFRSVRGRLILLVAALVLPVIALACAMILQGYRNERNAVANTLLGTARAVAGVADAKVHEAALLLKTLATSTALQRDDLAGVDAMARDALKNDARWFALIDPDGHQRINTRVPFGTTLPPVKLNPAMRTAADRDQVYVSDRDTAFATDELVLHVARPYFRAGKLKYVMVITIPPTALASALEVERYAPGKIVTVLDRHGTVIARSHRADKFVGLPGAPALVAAAAAQGEGVVDMTTLEHIPALTAFSRARCGWSAAISVPKSELYVASQRLLAWGGIGSALLIIVAITMAAWIGRALVRSTDVLLAEAAALGRGEMPAEVSGGLDEGDFVSRAMRRTAATLLRRTHTLEVLTRINAGLVSERNVQRIVQSVTDAGRELSGAQVAGFAYRLENAGGEKSLLYSVSGTPPPFAVMPPHPLAEIEAVFAGAAVLRCDDISGDPRCGRLAPHFGLPRTARSIRSYLAVAVKGRHGEIMGGLFLGHSEAGVFTQEAEDVVVGLTAEANIAIDNAKLYQQLALELDAKSKAEAELRDAQQRLSQHAHELERRVAERTASLRDAVTQMEEFSYTVSHDLRGPLRAMHGFADALLEDYGRQLDETARDYLARIQRASRRMDRLTTDLLSYSRVAGAEVRLEPVDVERLVRSTIEHYSELHEDAADVRVEAPLLPVMGHEPSLIQCLGNLLTNAAKFVKPGDRPEITVRTERRDGRVRLWVEDKGVGIQPEYQKQLFRMFERVPNPQPYEGTGVGLAIVRKAAEKMGGTCGVESDGLSGSRFWVELQAA